jgi:hypothetical protein
MRPEWRCKVARSGLGSGSEVPINQLIKKNLPLKAVGGSRVPGGLRWVGSD